MDELRTLLQQEYQYTDPHQDQSLIDVEKLDYAYVRECKNPRELHAILRVLKSGREGMYPHLEDFTEDRIREVEQMLAASAGSREGGGLVGAGAVGQSFSKSKKTINQLPVNDPLRAELDSWAGDAPNPAAATTPNCTAPIRSHFTVTSTTENPKSSKVTEVAAIEGEEPAEEIEKFIELPETATVHTFTSKYTKLHADTVSAIIQTLSEHSPPDQRPLLDELALQENQKANEYFKSGSLPDAVEFYTRSLLLDPMNANTWSNRSIAHFKLKEYKCAKEDATEALHLDQDNVKALIRRANASYQLEQYKECLTDLERAIALDANVAVWCRQLLEDTRKHLQLAA